MQFCKGINCEIFIAGRKAEEYRLENVSIADSTYKSHVVAVEGKAYVVKLDFSSTGARRHNYKLYADGVELVHATTTAPREGLSKSTGKLVETKSTKGRRAKRMQREEQVLKFGKLGTVDGNIEDTELRTEILDQLGTIKIIVWRANFRSRKVKSSSRETTKAGPIHEASVKGRALSHITKLGRKKYANVSGARVTRDIDPENRPFVTFIYRCASKEILQSEGIIPMDTVPYTATRAQAIPGGSSNDIANILDVRAIQDDQIEPLSGHISRTTLLPIPIPATNTRMVDENLSSGVNSTAAELVNETSAKELDFFDMTLRELQMEVERLRVKPRTLDQY
ncbi:hypothetical protein TWF696_000904 [Orbilia brochopaga]|uniref:DUF7918 domain-containing protein n=1 Tax=Orbilia brochopaga TaxID=3140254 RepID=A0AAV9VCR2_9PEZI